MGMTTSLAETVGATVRAELARKRISQTELAGHLHLTQTAVSRRITGRKAFDIEELVIVSRLVGVPVAELVAVEVAA